MKNPTNDGRRGRHRRRWTATGLLLGAPAIVVPYLLFVQEDSQAATVDGEAYYRLVSVRSGKVMDVNAFSTADGTRIQQWTDQDTANQQWKLRSTGDGYYELVNRNSGKVLGIAGDSTAQMAAAEQQTDSSSTSQEWRIDDVSGSDAVTFTSRKSGQVLDVTGGSTADGAAVIQYPGKGSTNQQWKLVKTAGTQAAGTGGTQTTAGTGPYAWKNAQVVGGGYVTGLVFNPREKGLLYARTDMGGAYRWDAAAEQWIPLTDWVGEKDWNLLGIDSLATDPVDPNRLYLGAGTYTNELGGQRRDPALHRPGPHLPAHRPALQAGRQRERPRGGRTAGGQPREQQHPAAGHPQERPVAQHRPRRDVESGLLVPRQGRGEQRRGHLLRDVRPGRQQDDLRRRRRQVHLPVPLHRRRQHLAGRLRAAHRPDAAARRGLR